VHPTQLYELAAALIGLPVCRFLTKRFRAEEGGLFSLYMAWFCLMRLMILPLRALPYAAVVTHVFYPGVYAALAILGLVLFCRKRKRQTG
jgi:prolipoprotein diacylglyceryltransferase